MVLESGTMAVAEEIGEAVPELVHGRGCAAVLAVQSSEPLL